MALMIWYLMVALFIFHSFSFSLPYNILSFGMDISEVLEMFDEEMPTIQILLQSFLIQYVPKPINMYTRELCGNFYVKQILNAHEQRSNNFLRMSVLSFTSFIKMSQMTFISSTGNMTVAEQISLFLRIIAQRDSCRSAYEIFQHFFEMFHRNFHKVLNIILTLSSEFINTQQERHMYLVQLGIILTYFLTLKMLLELLKVYTYQLLCLKNKIDTATEKTLVLKM